ncbi:hypothetical protein Q1695_000901 [Nippostrongylus brasiliensis]|nr:hypothetical protein Q1695_000901 [Nippostrongylus brasiliensis]
MVESVGAKRQDVVFDMSCEGVDELFPWVNIPVGISELEREDCYYSTMFDPILDELTDFSCKKREYISGITRLTNTRIQILCCRSRSRDEFNCRETVFNKPIGLSKSTIIEHENQIINAIRIEDGTYVVRFCDLSPRNIGDIYGDVKMAKPAQPRSTTAKSHLKLEKSTKSPLALVPITTQPPKSAFVPSSLPQESVTTRELPTTTAPVPTTSTTPSTTTTTTEKPRSTSTEEMEIIVTTETATESSSPMIGSEEDFTDRNSIVDAEVVRPTNTTPAPSSTTAEPETKPPVKVKAKKMKTTTTAEPEDSTTTTLPVAEQIDEEPEMNIQSIEDERNPQLSTSSPIQIEEIIKKLQSASSKSAEKLFKETVANLLNEEKTDDTLTRVTAQPTESFDTISSTPTISSSSENQLDISEIPEDDGIEDITVNDLSRITFRNEDFPNSSEKKFAIPAKLKLSKTDLPLKAGASIDDFTFLRPINAEGQRRAPIRTHRPHVEFWSSEETENGRSTLEQTTVETTRPKKIKKLRRKATRAYRVPSTEKPVEEEYEYTKDSSAQTKATSSSETNKDSYRVDVTTTSSPRRDLPPSRKVVESMPHKADNARSVDEETNASPFEDGVEAANDIHQIGGTVRNLDLRGNEDIEEVIMKLTASASNIRRSPVRDTNPKEQKSDKHAGEVRNKSSKDVNSMMKRKDGNKTHIPKGFEPIRMPEMAIFEKHHEDDIILEELIKASKNVDDEDESSEVENRNSSDDKTEVTENLVLVNSKSFIGGESTTSAQETTTTTMSNATETVVATVASKPTTATEYDPSLFYHTPIPKPPKKEKVLTFCTKDVALRDSRNMVIACGGENDIWYPSRCPHGADCFLSQDSTYRLCCPVSSG